MRAGNRSAFVLAVTMVLLLGRGLSAHRLDEVLQAARIAIAPDRASLELDMTPGIAVADGVIADIDRDRDGALSADEKRAYVARVLGAIELELDGQPLRVQPIAATFPDLDTLRRGEAAIQLQADAVLPRLYDGGHQLLFRNTHDREVSVYLANALVPQTDRIGVTAQRRDGGQSELTIEFVTRPGSAISTRMWLLGSLAGVATLAGLLTRGPRGRTFSGDGTGSIAALRSA